MLVRDWNCETKNIKNVSARRNQQTKINSTDIIGKYSMSFHGIFFLKFGDS